MSDTEPNCSEQAGNIDSPPSSPFNNAIIGEPSHHAEQYDDSPPTSPVSSSGARELGLSPINASASSPPSSQLKNVRKRPAYGAYFDDPSEPVRK